MFGGKFGDKGVSFTLEAVIAATIIITALLFFFKPQVPQENYLTDVQEKGYYCLKSLDDDRNLREYAIANDVATIENNLMDCLTPFNYTVQICRSTCTSTTLPENKDIIISKYYIAGKDAMDPLYVKLNMWYI